MKQLRNPILIIAFAAAGLFFIAPQSSQAHYQFGATPPPDYLESSTVA
jgi:hypothetical protein